ncbi:hypothetical protein MKW92_029097 [Papaver armeniacum]|nr:hypothetical protein MKW92_029097 [Papaver armeniacum]
MANLELWETLKQSITAYTGLSPATFVTVVALALAFYYVVSGLFGSNPAPPQRHREIEEEREPLPPPVQLGEIGEDELKAYDGSDPKKPLLMAIKGQIYDVSQSRMFYGPGGPYALFTGKDASRALAKMSFEDKDLTGDTTGLGPFEIEALQDWEYKFMSKYVKVGTVKKTVPVVDGSSTSEAAAENAPPAEKAAPAETAEEHHATEEVKAEPAETAEEHHTTEEVKAEEGGKE